MPNLLVLLIALTATASGLGLNSAFGPKLEVGSRRGHCQEEVASQVHQAQTDSGKAQKSENGQVKDEILEGGQSKADPSKENRSVPTQSQDTAPHPQGSPATSEPNQQAEPDYTGKKK
jgi:hypothetical protein